MNTVTHTRRVAISLAILVGTVLSIQAADDPTTPAEKRFLPWEKGSFKFGAFVAAFNSDIGFGINNAAGVTFNAEELLDLDSTLLVFRAEAMYRPGKSLRNQIDISYSSYHRDGHTSLSEEIDINGMTFPAGAEVQTVFNFDIIRGTYSYAFLQDERMRIAVGLGVYAVPLRYEVEGQTTGGRSKVEGADVTLPLPALALRTEFQLIPRLFLNASMDAMYLQMNDFEGSLLDVTVGLEYRPWKHFGFGLAYNALSVDVEAGDSKSDYPGVDFVGSVDVKFSGLLLYGKWSF